MDADRLIDADAANAIIGANLRALRAKRKLSRAAMHELTGIPAITIRRIEDGKRDAPAVVLLALCQALGVNAGEFLDHVQRELKEAGGIHPRRTGSSDDLP
ncbi:helix-turn-helix domain-containing protein [Nocardia sp. CA-290969]|uniref:helix-turn-helix domain-containing protein n=1 Tax=Nocardia sp. CA-290969 TaxID=3239986 RepID=UPI003D9417A1